MRNSGWYIPFWRKPKRQSGGTAQERNESKRRARTRTDDELDRVRDEWVLRYTGRVKAFKILKLSVGTPPEEITARYESLLADVQSMPAGAERDQRRRELREAYETLRVEA